MRKGFTLIELMIVVAIIAIIAAIAIPNLMQARIAANESNAIGALKAIATNQEIFRKNNRGSLTVNQGFSTTRGFARAVAGLRVGVNNDTPAAALNLISLQVAEASGLAPGADGPDPAAAVTAMGTNATFRRNAAYQGYIFLESAAPNPVAGRAGFDTPAGWVNNFAVFAYPAIYERTGVNTYWNSDEGVILMNDLGAATNDAAPSVTINPQDPDDPTNAGASRWTAAG